MAALDESCATCARYLSNIIPQYDEKSEKPIAQDRRLDCCGRVICGNCIHNNSRFATYCPFCQISTHPSPLPQGLRDPPSYEPSSSNPAPPPSNPPAYADELPSYSSLNTNQQPPPEKPSPPAEDVLHFLDHSTDNLTSLSLRYGVPIQALRKSNNITSDHLLLARRTILIPGAYYKGSVSLSPRPIEGEEEERRKALVRKWMVKCKVAEYDVAVLYLEQANYDLEMAVGVYEDDERWEREHPMKGKGKAKARNEVGRRRFTGQRS